MTDASFLAWPFFDDGHRDWAERVERWSGSSLPALLEGGDDDLDATYRCVGGLVRALGEAGLLRACVPAVYGGLRENMDVRSLCLSREILARTSGLADFALAMQGLGSAPITLAGDESQKRAYLPRVAADKAIPAFALSEPNAGSDVAATEATAVREGSGWWLDGVKTWISNAGLADFYVIFARTGEGPGSRVCRRSSLRPTRRGWMLPSASTSSPRTRSAPCGSATAGCPQSCRDRGATSTFR